MGSSNSTQTRSAIIENDSPNGVIEISDDVVQRLKLGLSKVEQKQEEVKPDVTLNVPQALPSSYPSPIAPPPQIIYAEPILAHDILRKKEEDLKKNDEYWKARLAEVEETYKKTNLILEDEYHRTIETVKKQFEKSRPSYKQPVCVETKEKLIKCLEAYTKEPLKCSALVNEFTKCVYDSNLK